MKNIEWTHKAGDSYLVTGTDTNGKRFRIVCATWLHARGINLQSGCKWLVRDGKKTLLVKVSGY